MIHWLTVKQVMAAEPCSGWSRERVEQWFAGRKRARLTTLLRDEQVQAADRWWVLCYAAGLDDRTLWLLAADVAEMALPVFERQYPDDPRPRQPIEVARRYARGTATEDEMRAAYAAACAAAYATTEAAAWDAACVACAAYAAWAVGAAEAVEVAAKAAAQATARKQQLAHALHVVCALERAEPWPEVKQR